MGIVFGYLCLLCFCLLIAKTITRKFYFEKADKIFMKLHKGACAILMVLCLLHFMFVLPVFNTRSILVIVTGIVTIILLVLLVFFCHMPGKERIKKLWWHKILAGTMLLCIVGHIVAYYIDYCSYQVRVGGIHLQKIDTEKLTNGSYIGEYDAGYIYAKVQVTVLDGRIQDIILLEHNNERGQAAEKIISDIINTQRVPVDAVSGATNSSKVIQQAIQNALTGKTKKAARNGS